MSMISLYFILVFIPGIESLASFLAVGGIIATLCIGFMVFMFSVMEDLWDDEEFKNGVIKWGGKWLKGLALVLVVSVIAPDESQLMKIIGGYVVTNVEGVEQLPENLVKYANEFLKVGETEPEE